MYDLEPRRTYIFLSPFALIPVYWTHDESCVYRLYMSLVIISLILPLVGIIIFMSYVVWYFCFRTERSVEHQHDLQYALACLCSSLINCIYIFLFIQYLKN